MIKFNVFRTAFVLVTAMSAYSQTSLAQFQHHPHPQPPMSQPQIPYGPGGYGIGGGQGGPGSINGGGQLVQKSLKVYKRIQLQAPSLQPMQRQALRATLDQALAILDGKMDVYQPTPEPSIPPQNNFPPPPPPPPTHFGNGPYSCDTSSNKLLDGSFNLVHDFANSSDCQEAMGRVQQGKPFCDFYFHTLYTASGTLLYDYSNEADCRNAMNNY